MQQGNIFLIILCVVIFAAAMVTIYLILKANRRVHEMDELEGHDFEYYCADLLKKDSFENVEVTKGSGDFGVDILAEKDGITYAFQCKCYDDTVGVKAVQEIYAGRDYYDRMVGVVMTNQYFTEPAQMMAGKLRIILWDRDKLDELSV